MEAIVRAESVRISPHLYNTGADTDHVFAAIASSL
jgi:selenocysteine lyase/cysteine desulfurase